MKIRPCFDLTGMVFGFWSVIERSDIPESVRYKKKRGYWVCLCKCGYVGIVRGNSLRSGVSKSCGCRTIKLKEEDLGNKH